MATYNSDLMTHKVPFRGLWAGQEHQVTGTIKIPSGKKLVATDVLKFMRIGQYCSLRRLQLAVSGELDDGTVALDGSIGWLQAFAPDGTTALAVNDGRGTIYTSPVSDPDGIIAAGNAPLITLLQGQGPVVVVFSEDAAHGNAFAAAASGLAATGLAGVVDLGITITTSANGDAAEDVYIRFTADLLQKEAPQGEWVGTLADDEGYRYDVNGSSGGLVS